MAYETEDYDVKCISDHGIFHLCTTHNGSQWSSISIHNVEHEIPKIIEVLTAKLDEIKSKNSS